jgi:hypothetical protein
MSHVETCKVAFKDLAAVKAACKALGVTFVEGKTHFNWYGQHVGDYPITKEMSDAGITKENIGQCAHVIQVPGTTWEVGLWPMKNQPGSFLPVYDFYGGQGAVLQKALCKGPGWPQTPKNYSGYSVGLEKLADHYSLEVLKAKARAKGYQFKETQVNGKIKLVVSLGN